MLLDDELVALLEEGLLLFFLSGHERVFLASFGHWFVHVSANFSDVLSALSGHGESIFSQVPDVEVSAIVEDYSCTNAVGFLSSVKRINVGFLSTGVLGQPTALSSFTTTKVKAAYESSPEQPASSSQVEIILPNWDNAHLARASLTSAIFNKFRACPVPFSSVPPISTISSTLTDSLASSGGRCSCAGGYAGGC